MIKNQDLNRTINLEQRGRITPMHYVKGSFLLFCLIVMAASCGGEVAREFFTPWTLPQRPLVIDAYYQNPIDWEQLATEPRVVGIIHKATEGCTMDPKYQERKTEAKARGYLWGSYHLGLSGNPEQQADCYLEAVNPTADEAIALDLEDVTSSSSMSIDEAIRFIQRIREQTGRYPMVYGNHAVITEISTRGEDGIFSETPLWYARFRQHIPDFPGATWASYTLWQFSSELNVQIRIPGTRSDIDVNVFPGTKEEIRRRWPFS